MNLEDSDKIILEESRKSYDNSMESIKSYDSKIQHIVILSTGILSFIFTIGGFFSVELTLENIQSNIILYIGYFATMIGIFILLVYSVILCLKTYTMPEYRIIRPIKMWEGLSNCSTTKEFMKDLIEEIDHITYENSQLSYVLWDKYTKAIAVLASGIVLTILLVIFSICIKIVN